MSSPVSRCLRAQMSSAMEPARAPQHQQALIPWEARQRSPVMLGSGRGLIWCDGVMRGPRVQWECGDAVVALGGCHGTGQVRVTIFSRRNSYGEKGAGEGL